ncbi:DnaD domain protein [Sporosarcina sp. ANT_H38]|uniref:DnaD domain protein n=1 Tax=Sporosarcina sp. ANT_H38 TaxID=2597358 RepID=UPI0011F2F8D5|nr:DnaD domain protein [Sporosarcina sp. ANT_H38]KAA0941591.1 DnaD domain protein [Sporosarcina sp. ANT_H38]
MAGWISLHRKLMDNPIYSNAHMLKLWIHCLMKASHKEHDHLVGNQMVKLEVGQFVTGRNALADEFNKGAKKDDVVSAITLWRWLKNFEEWQMLNIKTTTKYSVVTVSNWSEHQQHEQQVNNKRTTDEQQVNTNNNVNKGNKENKREDDKPAPMNPFIFFEQEGFGTISSFTGDILNDLIDDFGEAKVMEAMKETRMNGSNSLNYTKKILTNPKPKRDGGASNVGTYKQSDPRHDERQSRISEANERRKRIAGI